MQPSVAITTATITGQFMLPEVELTAMSVTFGISSFEVPSTLTFRHLLVSGFLSWPTGHAASTDVTTIFLQRFVSGLRS